MSVTSTRVQHADIRFHEAAEALRSFVGCFWVVTADRDATIRLVPDGTTSISIQLGGGEASQWYLRGPLVQPEERRFTSPATLVGVRLRPGVAFLLGGVAAHSLVGRHLPLASLEGFDELVIGQASLRTPAECIEVLERFLIRRLGGTSVHPVVASAIGVVEREHGCLQVEDIAARCGVSPRHLNRLMRTWVGYGAKRLSSVARFQQALALMKDSPQPAAALASETGFSDQSHLTLDVNRFAGTTPGRLASGGVADFSKTRCEDLP